MILLGRAAIVWMGLALLAILNGTLRIGVLVPRIGEARGHVVSTLLLCAGIGAVAWATLPWIGPASLGQALGVGAMWLVMTLVFEFGFGHYGARKPWADLLADYDIVHGRIWILVLVTTAAAPSWAARSLGLV